LTGTVNFLAVSRPGVTLVDSDEADGPVYDWEDISGTGTLVTMDDEQHSPAQDIGFIFNFYGVDYTQVYLGDNGYLSFVTDSIVEGDETYIPEEMPYAGKAQAMIAGAWTDLYPPDGGTFHVERRGTGSNRYFIVQYTDVPVYDYRGPTEYISQQYKLFEGSNVIEVHTLRMDITVEISAGIEDEFGVDGLSYAWDQEITPGTAVRYTPTTSEPECTNATANVDELWPPQHQFVPVVITGVEGFDAETLLVTIDSVFQDEPVNTVGDGNFEPDASGVGTSQVSIRAERTGNKAVPGNGRVYHVGFTATDGATSCSGVVTLGVPHDQGKGGEAIDDGPLYDSTQP
jgi:hypothetical protein